MRRLISYRLLLRPSGSFHAASSQQEIETMPLDIAAPQTTVAELHYLKRTAERPARYVMEPPPGVPVWNGIDDPHMVTIEDARGRELDFTLDRNGFALIKAPTAVR